MTVPARRLAPSALALVALLAGLPSPGLAQSPSALSTALDSLLDIPVSTASKFAQTSREAAASVTVITSDEIRRLGFRTVADALETVPGFYTTNNLSYQSLGVRGFGPLSGDNNRVLLLVDGHPLNENFLDGFRAGSALEIELASLDRIEVVRGPGSALYGSNAMLAVVNLIPKTGRQIDGVHAASEAGMSGVRQVSVLAGRELRNGLGVRLSTTWQDASGAAVYFPEWDNPATSNGVAAQADWQNGGGLQGTLTYGGWKLTGHFSDRDKGSPTAPFGSDFGSARAMNSDRRFFGEMSLDRDLAPGRNLFLRAYYDGADWGVVYPYASTGDIVGETSGRWFGSEARFRWDPSPAHRFTFGAEVRRNARARVSGADPALGQQAGDYRSTVSSAFAQADLQLLERLQLALGARADVYSSVGAAVSPRAGLVYHAFEGTTLKALYGEAFRAPNQVELNVHAPPFIERNPAITPERIRTAEVVWEQRVGPAAYATVSAYHYAMTDLIVVTNAGQNGAIQFQNSGSKSARGVEASVDANLHSMVSAKAAYSLQLASRTNAQAVVNAPRHSARVAISTRAVPMVELAVRLTYDSERGGRPGKESTDGYLLTHASIATRSFDNVRVSLVGENVFDVSYTHPAGPEYLQNGHPQAGRTFRLRFDLSF